MSYFFAEGSATKFAHHSISAHNFCNFCHTVLKNGFETRIFCKTRILKVKNLVQVLQVRESNIYFQENQHLSEKIVPIITTPVVKAFSRERRIYSRIKNIDYNKNDVLYIVCIIFTAVHSIQFYVHIVNIRRWSHHHCYMLVTKLYSILLKGIKLS